MNDPTNWFYRDIKEEVDDCQHSYEKIDILRSECKFCGKIKRKSGNWNEKIYK